MFLPDDPESNTRNADNDKEEKVLVTPEDLMTEQPSCREILLSMTSPVEQSVFLKISCLAEASQVSICQYKTLLDYDDTGTSQVRPGDVYESLACSSLVDLSQLLSCDGLRERGAGGVTRDEIYLW